MRYDRTPLLNLGSQYGTSEFIPAIRKAIKNGTVRYEEYILTGKERLDTIAAQFYGDSTKYDILAAASGIGNCLQVPPGTLIIIPNLEDIQGII
jgi:nucleoid-associated protein YgaU